MPDDHLTFKLSRDQALVLSDWLCKMMGSEEFDRIVDREPAVWSALYATSGALETTLAEVFMSDYARRLEAARTRLLASMDDGFLPR